MRYKCKKEKANRIEVTPKSMGYFFPFGSNEAHSPKLRKIETQTGEIREKRNPRSFAIIEP